MLEHSIAVIGDIVQSRRFRGRERESVQSRLSCALDEVNCRFSPAILSRFIITVGDEFQGLLRDAAVIPEILWHLEISLRDIEIRIGVGQGRLDTELRPEAIGMDGPVWHRAREAIREAKAGRHLGGLFRGFGAEADTVLSAFGLLLHHVRNELTDRQLEVVALVRQGLTQEEVGARLGISQQAVSQHVIRWRPYREGEKAWRLLLSHYSF